MSAYGVSTCEDHDDCLVVFTGKRCPVCTLISEKDTEISDLETKVNDAEQFIKEGETG